MRVRRSGIATFAAMASDLPTTTSEITAEWLTDALRGSGTIGADTITGTAGVYRRRKRVVSQLRRFVVLDEIALALAYPPTKKKIGITWITHVNHAAYGIHSSVFIIKVSPSGVTQIDAASQCPKTTTRRAMTRQTSTTRLRVGGVSSTARWTRVR